MSEWASVPLHRLLAKHDPKQVIPEADARVRSAGVRWYGAGLFVREERAGSEVKGKCYALKPGALIYNRLFAWKQAFAVVGDEYAGVVVSNEFPQFDVDAALATPDFVALYCSSPLFASQALALSTGSAAVSRNRLKEEAFLRMSITLPPLPIQARTVQVIQAVDDTITATEEETERLASVLKIRRSDLANDHQFIEVPAETAFDIRLGRQRSPQRAIGPSMTPYLRSANIGYDVLRLDDVLSMDFNEHERERYALEDGDVLVSEGSAGEAAVGMPASWHGEIDGPVCFQNTLLCYRAIKGITTPDFVRHWCLWAYESGAFRDVAPAGVNIRHIGSTRAKAMPVRLPDIPDQQAIAAQLEPLSVAVASLRDEATQLRVARAALLEALLTRKIEVSV